MAPLLAELIHYHFHIVYPLLI